MRKNCENFNQAFFQLAVYCVINVIQNNDMIVCVCYSAQCALTLLFLYVCCCWWPTPIYILLGKSVNSFTIGGMTWQQSLTNVNICRSQFKDKQKISARAAKPKKKNDRHSSKVHARHFFSRVVTFFSQFHIINCDLLETECSAVQC